MKIALDYDKTYSADKEFFGILLSVAEAYGHEVYLVTARHAAKDTLSLEQVPQQDRDLLKEIIYCNGVAKRWHLHHNHDLDIDVWVDDRPDNILNNSTASKELLVGWRASEEYNA